MPVWLTPPAIVGSPFIVGQSRYGLRPPLDVPQAGRPLPKTLERYENQCRFAPGCLLPAWIAALCSRAKHQEWGTDYWPTSPVCWRFTRRRPYSEPRRQFEKTIQNYRHAFDASFLLAWRFNHYQEFKCRRMVVNCGNGRKAGCLRAAPTGRGIRSSPHCSSRI